MHYLGMLVIVAAISLFGSNASGDFKRSYEAAVSGDFGDAFGHATAGIRRAFREADGGRANDNLRIDARYERH